METRIDRKDVTMSEASKEIYSAPALLEVGTFSEATQGSLVPISFDGYFFHG